MNKTIIALTVLAALSSNAFAAGEISVTGNSNTTQTSDASLDKSNHAIQDNVSTVNGTTIDPSITNQYTDSSNRSASANGGTYTTGALTAQGGSIGNTSNQSSATTGASSSSIGNTSTGGNSLVGGTQTAQTGASTSSTGAVTVNPTNTNGQSLADNSTRNTASKATGGSVGNTSTGASTSSTGAVTVNPTNTQGLTDASTRNTQQQQSLTGGSTTVTPTSNQNAAAHNSAKTGSNTSTTNVDASDRSSTSYKSLALVLPSVQATPASTVAIGNIVKETMTCGALQRVVRDPVKGTYIGLFKTKHVDLGTDDSIEPYLDANGQEQMFKTVLGADGRMWVVGHQPVLTYTVLSVSGNRNLNLGGGSNEQAFGQAGLGSSSAMTRMVSKVQLRECVYGVLEPQASSLKVRG